MLDEGKSVRVQRCPGLPVIAEARNVAMYLSAHRT
jgi:hypothetical protein